MKGCFIYLFLVLALSQARAQTPPANFRLDNGPRYVQLSWDTISSAGVRYQLYRSVDPNNNTLLLADNLNQITYRDTLPDRQVYYYWIKRVGSSTYSSRINTTVTNAWYLDSAGGKDDGIGSLLRPYKKASLMVGLATNGDSLLFGPGTYIDNIVYESKVLSFIGIQGAEKTRFQALYQTQILVMYNAGNSLVKGITFVYPYVGSLGLSGSDIFIQASEPVVEECIFRDNSGGSLIFFSVNPDQAFTLRNCLVYNNHAMSFIAWGGILNLYNLTYANNWNTRFLSTGENTQVNISNSILWDSLPLQSHLWYKNQSYTIQNSVVKPGTYYAYADGVFIPLDYSLRGNNIDLDPQFVDPAKKDFRLKNSSPAIGLGYSGVLLTKDFEGNSRPAPVGSNPDAGAYENSSGLPPPYITKIRPGNKRDTLYFLPASLQGVSSIKLYRSLTPSAGTLLTTLGGGTLSYIDDGNLQLGVKYYYKIEVVYAGGGPNGVSPVDSVILYNQKPFADTLPNKYLDNIGLNNYVTVSSDGSKSYDPDGSIVQYRWYVNNTLAGSSGSSFTYNYLQGQNVVKLVVQDNDGDTSYWEYSIFVSAFVKNFPGGILSGPTAATIQDIYVADSTYYGVDPARLQKMDQLGTTKFTFSLDSKIFATPSVLPDSSVLITSGASMYGFNAAGSPIWPFLPLGGIGYNSAAIDTILKRIYIGVSNGSFFAINYKTGLVVSNYHLNVPILTSAVITPDRKLIFTNQSGTLFGFDLTVDTGSVVSPRWTYNLGSSVTMSPALDSLGNIYVGTISGSLTKLNLVSGGTVSVLWTQTLDGEIRATPVIDALGAVYAGTLAGTFYKLDPNNGSTIWTRSLTGGLFASPSMSDYSNIYLGDLSGMITSINTNGQLNWRYNTGSSIKANLLTISGTTYAGTLAGKLYGFYDDPNTNSIAYLADPKLNRNTTYQGSLAALNLVSLNAGVTAGLQKLMAPPVAIQPAPPVWGTYQANFKRTGSSAAKPKVCSSQGATTKEYINQFKLANINFVSGNNSGYANYTGTQIVALTKGKRDTIQIYPAWSGGGKARNEGYAVWIDYNRNAVFESSELVLSKSASTSTIVSDTVRVPASVAAGPTVLRVIMKYNATPLTACETSFSGETEDYGVLISEDLLAPSQPLNLSASNITSSSLTLKWTPSGDNVQTTSYDVYSNAKFLMSTNSTMVNLSGLNPNTKYDLYIRAKDAVGNQSVKSDILSVVTLTQYCISRGSSNSREYINRFQLGSIDNSLSGTGWSSGGYGDYTQLAANLIKNGLYTATIYPGWSGTARPETYRIWIDYNQNGSFADSGEQVVNVVKTTASFVAGTFTVPGSALTGVTRMRVTIKYNTAPSSCETNFSGEVEDYLVMIGAAAPAVINASNFRIQSVAEQSSFGIRIYPNPVIDQARLSFRGFSRGPVLLRLIDPVGRLAMQKEYVLATGTDQLILKLPSVPSGIYILQATQQAHIGYLRLVKE